MDDGSGPQVGCGTGAFWPSGTVVTICTASGARQRSVKPSAHSGPGSRIFGPGPRPRPLRLPMPDYLSPVPACVRASRSPWFSPLGPGARCTVCPSCGPSDPSRRVGRVCLNRLPQAAGPRVRGGPTIQRHAGPNGQLPDGDLPGLLRSQGPHAAGSGTQQAMGQDARWRGRQRWAGPRHALYHQAAAGPAHVGTGARREWPTAQLSGDTVCAPRGNCAAGRGAGAVPGSGRHRYGRCTGSVSGIVRIRSGLVAQGGRSVGRQARLCG